MRSPTSPVGGKICRSGQLLPGLPDRNDSGKAWFYWVFLHGTALAEKHAHERSVGRCVRPYWSSAMLFALGAASSAIDALKALTSSKSSAQTTGLSQDGKSAFDLSSSGSSASVGSGSGSGSGGGCWMVSYVAGGTARCADLAHSCASGGTIM